MSTTTKGSARFSPSVMSTTTKGSARKRDELGKKPTNSAGSKKLEASQESKKGAVCPKGYSMACEMCGVPDCKTGFWNRPVYMSCHICGKGGSHWAKDCPSDWPRGPPMPEWFSCYYRGSWQHV